mmetsp:Transcript_25430/g.52167  ORF Transcript_25430/g.52167 Transcript_25430/m.52167 type:complete len:111 (+) Transcript_25430:187-519(+)
MVLTFEEKPQWHKLNSGDTIVKKVRSLYSAGWGSGTNFEAAYYQIMDVCCKHRLAKEDVPSLIVFSDMKFNEAQCSCYYSDDCIKGPDRVVGMHEVIRSKFANTAKLLDW